MTNDNNVIQQAARVIDDEVLARTGRSVGLIASEHVARTLADAGLLATHDDQAVARDVEAEARAEAERRYPGWVNGTVPFPNGLEEERDLAREYFIEGALWATGGAR